MVFETLRHHQLFAKASKCQFGRSSVGFLGHIISARSLGVDPAKVEAIRYWALRPALIFAASSVSPTTTAASFRASQILQPSSPRASFAWAAAEQRSFDDLKAALTSAPVLRVWDLARPTRIVTDASELAVSGILEQPNDRWVYHPVAYESRKLTSAARAGVPSAPPRAFGCGVLPQAFRPYLFEPALRAAHG
jgi:hypothetical protein